MRSLPFDLADLRAFASVVEAGSFARASERLGSSKSVLSRRVAALEFALGTQLLVRDQRGARTTEAGMELHRTAAEVLARLEQIRDDAVAGIKQIAGPIRLTAPLSFGVSHLSSALAAFATAHPDVVLDVRLDDHVVDLVAGGFDLGLRIGGSPDESLVARRLASLKPSVLGSPEYLARRGRPVTPADLAGHDVLEYTNVGYDEWRAAFGPVISLSRMKVRLRSDNGDILRDAAISGAGLVILPSFLASRAVEAKELEALLLDHPLPAAGLYAVAPPGRPSLRRVRALIDHLGTWFGETPRWTPPEGRL